MVDAGSLLDLDGEVFSSHSLNVNNIVSQEIRFTIIWFHVPIDTWAFCRPIGMYTNLCIASLAFKFVTGK